ncbi:sugar ABC transporter permease [soil metagenome]
MKKAYLLPRLLLAPALALYLAFSVFPLLRSVLISFQHYAMESPDAPTWAGLANYTRLFHDPAMLHSALVTAGYALITVPIVILGALTAALSIHHSGRIASWVRPIVFLPMVVAPSIIAVIWFTLFDGGRGALNWALAVVSLHFDWLGSSLALPSVAIAQAWGGIAFGTLLLTVALTAIPDELYEAATVDGAGPVGAFFSITLPGLAKTLALLLVLTTVGAMRDFTYPFVITKGGPASATSTYTYQIYRTAFIESPLDLGYACAMSVVFAFVLAAISLALLKLRNRGI